MIYPNSLMELKIILQYNHKTTTWQYCNEDICSSIDIFQTVGNENNYELNESSGITTVTFVGTARDLTKDVGITLPRGGIFFQWDQLQDLVINHL